MGSTAFPSEEARSFAKFEALLGREDLSLGDIEEIEQQIVVQTTDKTRGFALNLLNRCDAKKPALVDRQIQMFDQASSPVSKIKLLTPLIGYLDEDVVEKKIEAIQMEASLSSNQTVRDAVTKQLEHVKFAQAKPLIKDLDTFIADARKVGAAVERTGSLALLSQFNAPQLHEVQRAIARMA